jgi:alpha-galactosidase
MVKMKHHTNYVTDIKIAYIGGGSRGWARGLMSDLAKEKALSGTVSLYDIDEQAAHDNERIGNQLMLRKDTIGNWKYQAVSSLKEALTGADFVIISILPGTFHEMESDVHAPEKYGIYQSVGDTVGPGGIVRALRTIPMYVTIANAIMDFSPNAWVINYTNPMSICVRTLYKVFPKVKAFGCCHEVFGTQTLLQKMLLDMCDLEVKHRSEIQVNVLGINHFTWIDKATYNNIDLFPIYREFCQKYREEGFIVEEAHTTFNPEFGANKVKFDLFKRFGIIAAAGDRHLAEFCPGKWYLGESDPYPHWNFARTPVKNRIEAYHKLLEDTKQLVSGEKKFDIKETGEEGVRQIKALVGLDSFITNVNIPNMGQIPDIPLGAIVETNALFQADSVTPVMAGKLPSTVNGLVTRHVYNQETLVTSGLLNDYELAFAAFVNDPLVNLSLSDGKELYDEMLDNTKAYLMQ